MNPSRSNYLAAAATETGLVRNENQDSIASLSLPKQDWTLFVLCDGMGGNAGGKTASSIAVDIITKIFKNRVIENDANPLEILSDIVTEANRVILGRANADPELQGMGTTCALLAVHHNQAYVAHVGDSRIYRIRYSGIKQLTIE